MPSSDLSLFPTAVGKIESIASSTSINGKTSNYLLNSSNIVHTQLYSGTSEQWCYFISLAAIAALIERASERAP
jgi:hypothetical protein